MFGFSKSWNPRGLHAYVTGGSTGLGLALAKILVLKGAHVSIVARNQEKLDKAIEELELLRVDAAQKVLAYSFSLTSAETSTTALEAVCAPFDGKAPDAVFACAGASRPAFFVEMEAQHLEQGMRDGYWVQAWTAWAAAKMMAKQQKKGGKIVLVSSTLGYMSFLGWASYSPAKHALRGLADTLQSELMLYGISVHIYFPPTMHTPGYEEENKTKPQIVKEIEDADEGLTAEQAAKALYRGVESGQAHITGDLITSLFRASTRGASPKNNWILDGVYDAIAYVATPIWRSSVDKKVVSHRMEHHDYLAKKGFFT
ncbi:oxidoreductase [Crucibulum laeve]|uniref:3-dehydrosphinganine reductase n=1 Tax=Crucibulum laeve TaxID=68775 RepID=A0A5C3LY16_9AGAR|nr:oxidoreductase [Crucibulum laeve]